VALLDPAVLSSQRNPMEERKVMRSKAYWSKMEAEQKKTERMIKLKLEQAAKQKEEKFQERFSAITEGAEFTRDMDRVLDLYDEAEKRKAIKRYKEWNENVFGKIQKGIEKEICSRDVSSTNSMRRTEYQKYLEICKAKDSIFLDIVIESDYDPFVPNRNSVRFDTGVLDDPTLRPLTKAINENSILGSTTKNSKKKDSRGTLPVPMWGKGKLESTPHGYFEKLMNSKTPSFNTSNTAAKEVHVDIDHYSFPVGKAATDAEFPAGKRANFPYLKWDPNQHPPLEF